MEEIRSLAGTNIDDLYVAWAEAFHDYERTRNKAELKKMLHRRGYVAALSYGAFDGERLVGFTLNGTGLFDGKQTVYDTGTGTIPEFRGRGLAAKIFTASIPFLNQGGMEQYLLEVLQHNIKAITVYSNLGFKVKREFNYFVQEPSAVQLTEKAMPKGIVVKETDLTKKEAMMRLWDFVPSWQNNFDAIERNLADFEIVGAFDDHKLVGYGIIEPASGDIPQLAVDKVYRGNGIGTGILKELLRHNKHKSVQIINTEATCDSITEFLEKNGIPKRGMQFEMIKDIS